MRPTLRALHSWRLAALLVLCCMQGCWQSGAEAWGIGSSRFPASEHGGKTLHGVGWLDAGSPEICSGMSGTSRVRWPVLATRGTCLRLRGGAIMHNDQKVLAEAKKAKKVPPHTHPGPSPGFCGISRRNHFGPSHHQVSSVGANRLFQFPFCFARVSRTRLAWNESSSVAVYSGSHIW